MRIVDGDYRPQPPFHNDAEDAFQATFLVLMKKSRGLWVRDSLGPWIHQVAYRTALRARASAIRRRRHEQFAAALPTPTFIAIDREQGEILHEEIDRLPAKFRAPIVLCDLEGRTHEQAARHLGWPVGSVKSRLSRGRDRLVRRGLASQSPRMTPLMIPLPAKLVDSTTHFVIQALTARTVAQSTALILAYEMGHVMSITRWMKLASLFIATGVTLSGVGVLAQREAIKEEKRGEDFSKSVRKDDKPGVEAKTGKGDMLLAQRGSVEATKVADVYSEIEGQTTIVRLKPEGTMVKKGDLVGELDTSQLKDQLANLGNSSRAADSALQRAKGSRQVAEIVKLEYEQGVFPQELASLVGDIETAKAGIAAAEARHARILKFRDWLLKLLSSKGYARTADEIMAEVDIQDRLEACEQSMIGEKHALARATEKMAILEKFTKGRMTLKLAIELEQAIVDEKAKESASELEKQKIAKTTRMIDQCRLYAPGDGVVVYANDLSRNGRIQIEEGATVRERQKIFAIPNLSGPMRINIKVNESDVKRLALGQKARVTVGAFPGETFAGSVESIAPLPDVIFLSEPDRIVYTTYLLIEKSQVGLRPGMSASAEILIDK